MAAGHTLVVSRRLMLVSGGIWKGGLGWRLLCAYCGVCAHMAARAAGMGGRGIPTGRG